MLKNAIVIIGAAACLSFPVVQAGTVFAATADLAETGQTACFSSQGVSIACANTGQDGALLKGVAWPAPRFTNENGSTPVTGSVVVDQLTGLMWTRDGNGPGPQSCILPATKTKTWQAALDYVECLNDISFLGFSDWRLPNVNELASLVNSNEADPAGWLNLQGFSNVQSLVNFGYWSSTTFAANTIGAWQVDLSDGTVDGVSKGIALHVWPVRAGQ